MFVYLLQVSVLLKIKKKKEKFPCGKSRKQNTLAIVIRK